jgi:hypothetical protein
VKLRALQDLENRGFVIAGAMKPAEVGNGEDAGKRRSESIDFGRRDLTDGIHPIDELGDERGADASILDDRLPPFIPCGIDDVEFGRIEYIVLRHG